MPAGMGMKGWDTIKQPRTMKSKKFEFIEWLHGLGEKSISGANAVKVSPEQAEVIMRMVGTQVGADTYPNEAYMAVRVSDDGKPRFKLYELIDKYQIKGYMGKRHVELQAMTQKSLLKEAANPAAVEDDASDVESDEE